MKNSTTETVLTPVDTELEKYFKLPEVYDFSHEMLPNGRKVGFTMIGTDARLSQWNRVYPGLIPGKRFSTLIDGGNYFTDHPVHGKLIKKGKRRITREEFPKDTHFSREFFDDTTENDVENAVNDVKSDFANGTGLHKCKDINTSTSIGKHYKRDVNLVYDLRKMQEKILKNFLNAIEHNETEMLCVSPTRSGKCAAAMFCAKEMKSDGNKVIVVVSAKVDVKDEWQRVVERPMNFDGFYFLDGDDLKANSNAIAKMKENGHVVIFLSLQDLKGEDVKEKHKELLKTSVDLLIIDETHFAARAPEYGEVLRKKDVDVDLDSEDDDSISKDDVCKYIKAKYWLHLTATPDITILDEFNHPNRPYQIVGYFTDKDLIDERDEWSFNNEISENPKSEVESPYAGLPNNMIIINDLLEAMKDMKRSSSSFLNDLFETKSTNKDGDYTHFVREEYVMQFLHMLDGSISDPNVLSFFSNVSIKKNGLGKHIVCILPRCAACDAMMELLQNNLHKFENLKSYVPLNLAGLDNKFSNAKSYKDKIDELDFEGKNTITFTVKRCLTGNTIPPWDILMFLSDMLSYKEYYQAMGRLKSSNIRTFEDKDGNRVKKIMKFQTICIDFNPRRALSMVEQKARIQSALNGNSGNDKVLAELNTELKTVPMVFYGGLKLSEVQPVEVLKKVNECFINRSTYDDVRTIVGYMNHSIFDSKVIRDINEKYKTVIIKRGNTDRTNSNSFRPFENGANPDIDPNTIGEDKTTTQSVGNEDVDKHQETEPITNPNQQAEHIEQEVEQEESNIETDANKEEDQKTTGFLKFIESICYFAILTESKVMGIKDIIDNINENADDLRIANHIGLDVNDVSNFYAEILRYNAKDLHNKIDDHIINTNCVLNGSVEEKMNILINKCDRMSENEVVLPSHIAKDMITLVFDNADNADDLNILDVASKQAEIAVAVYNIDPNKAKNVISLPSSSISYEFTRKMYSVMGLPVENVISDFTTFDLIGDKHNDIFKRLINMKINTAVGNIPYQENFGIKGGNSSNAKSIYNLFIDFAIKLDPRYICMITPSRWMTKSAQGIPSSWVDKMLTQNKFKVIHDFENENDCFKGVAIEGGVNYFLWDRDYVGKCNYYFHQAQNNGIIPRYDYLDSKGAGIVIRDPQAYSIVEKINNVNNNYFFDSDKNMSGLVSPKHFFDDCNFLTSNWTDYSDKKDDEHCIKYYVNINKTRTHRWISLDQLPKHKDTKDLHKVYIPAANGSMEYILGKPFYGEPNSVCSQTFLVIGYDAVKHNLSKEECQNIIKYIYTKFFRYLVSIKKITQNGPRGVYQFVPLQNFTTESDIDWSKSIDEIDQQLYAKYDLTADEIDFIESKIKYMNI
jgi:hypothetical protein